MEGDAAAESPTLVLIKLWMNFNANISISQALDPISGSQLGIGHIEHVKSDCIAAHIIEFVIGLMGIFSNVITYAPKNPPHVPKSLQSHNVAEDGKT